MIILFGCLLSVAVDDNINICINITFVEAYALERADRAIMCKWLKYRVSYLAKNVFLGLSVMIFVWRSQLSFHIYDNCDLVHDILFCCCCCCYYSVEALESYSETAV